VADEAIVPTLGLIRIPVINPPEIVGLVARTLFPEPVFVTLIMFFEASRASAVEAVKPFNLTVGLFIIVVPVAPDTVEPIFTFVFPEATMKTNVIRGNFSVGEYNEVSGKLGGLEKSIEHILRSVNTTESLIKDITGTSILHGSKIDAAHTRLDKIEPKVDTLEETEDKRKGAWAVIVWVAGAVGSIMGVVGGYVAKVLGLL